MTDKPKWTAGPWHVVQNMAGAISIASDLYHDERVASVVICPGEQENVQLIAAAPDLYEALALAEDVLSHFPFTSEIWPNGTHPNAGITIIRAALSKARG